MKQIHFKQQFSENVIHDVFMTWTENNEKLAKEKALNGEYTIEDDGQPEPVAEPTTDEILNAMLGVSV